MPQLHQIGINLVLARTKGHADLCTKAVIPKADSERVSMLLQAVHTSGLKDQQGYSPAYYAVMVDDTTQLQRLLNLGYSTTDPLGSLLTAAAYWNSVGATRVLLRRGIDPNKVKSLGTDPLVAAVSEGGPDVAKLLLEHGARPSNRDLRYALICKNQDVVNMLVRSGAPIDAFARGLASKYGLRLPQVSAN